MKIKVIDERWHHNGVKMQIETEINGEKVTEWFGFSHSQIKNGKWKEHVKIWAEKYEEKESKKEKLKGKEFDI